MEVCVCGDWTYLAPTLEDSIKITVADAVRGLLDGREERIGNRRNSICETENQSKTKKKQKENTQFKKEKDDPKAWKEEQSVGKQTEDNWRAASKDVPTVKGDDQQKPISVGME